MQPPLPKGPAPIVLLQEAIKAQCQAPHPLVNPTLYRLVGEWVVLADQGARPRDAYGVCQSLCQAGFVSGDAQGRDRSAYKEDPALMGRYCVGQVISGCRSSGSVYTPIGESLIALSERADLEALYQRAQLEASSAAGGLGGEARGSRSL